MNSLCDDRMIAKLYEASSAGVSIRLIVRGICCLRVGIPGISENITVSSIVGKFLEHSRIFYFYNDGAEEIFMGSADWMPRNLDRRVEIIFPVEDPSIKSRIMHILDVQLSDNIKAYYMNTDGIYEKLDRRGKKAIGSQSQFMEEAICEAKQPKTAVKGRRFVPIKAPANDEE
jgi:polyphosphate kinase